MAFIFVESTSSVGVGAFGDGRATTNMIPSSSGEAVFHLKELLKTAGWVVQASGDGTNFQPPASASNANDVVTTSLLMDQSGSWFIIKQPSIASGSVGHPGGRMFGFLRGATAGEYLIKYIPLTGSSTVQVLTGGSATEPSTTTQENVLKGILPNTTSTWFSSVNGSYRCSAGADNTAPYGFYMACWTAGGANAQTAGGAIVFDPLLASSYPDAVLGPDPTDDNDPYVIYCPRESAVFSDNPFLASSLSRENTDDNVPKCYFRKGLSRETFVLVTALSYAIDTGSLVAPNSLGCNPHNGKDDGLPIPYARRAAATAGGGVSPHGLKGWSSLMRWVSSVRGTGTALTHSTARDRIVVGHVSLPWDGSVPVI